MRIEEFDYLIGYSIEQATLDFQAKSVNLELLVVENNGVSNFDLSTITTSSLCVAVQDDEIIRTVRLVII